MSVLGISLGSHSVYVAVHSTETSNVEVLCDDLGFRSIPTVVGFRAGSGDAQCEVLVGHSAKQQQAKNPSNTFEDLRSLILDTGRDSVNVPLLDKDISVQELVSHVFRHIFNQVKQQTVAKGSPVKDCFLCLPADLPVDQMGAVKNRLVEAARAGGLRVKGFCEESVGPLVALELDSGRSARAVAAVVDIGWSRSSVSFYSVCNGFFSPVYSISDQSVHAKGFNDACVKFCIKDFMRRCKLDCSDSKRAVTRLSLQCEQGVKILINSQETTIVVDSLFEGMDYSGKISRSRFEDLCGMSGMAIKNMLKSSLVSAGLDAEDIDHVVLAGGGGAQPFVQSLVRSVFTKAEFPKNRHDSVELSSVGTAIHGGCYLSQGGEAAAEGIKYEAFEEDIVLCDSEEFGSSTRVVIFSRDTILPSAERIPINIGTDVNSATFFVFRVAPKEESHQLLGEVCVHISDAPSAPVLCFDAAIENSSAFIDISLTDCDSSLENDSVQSRSICRIPLSV